MINDKEGHVPSPLIMSTCTGLHHALMEWQKDQGVHPKACKSKLNAHRPDRSNYFNHTTDSGKNESCCTATGPKLLTSPGIADTYTLLMNTWNTLPKSYQQRVYKNSLTTVKHQILQAENPTPAVVISVEAGCIDKVILLDYLTSEVALEEPHLGSTDPNIPKDNNSTDDELHSGMPRGSRDSHDDGNQSSEHDAIPTPSRRQQPATYPKMFDLGTIDVVGYEGEDGDDADEDVDEEEEASHTDDRSTQNVECRGHGAWCRRVWVLRCGCGWGGISIASRWWINAECGGLMA